MSAVIGSRRTDWPMRQAVARIAAAHAEGRLDTAQAAAAMRARMVPLHVARRVLRPAHSKEASA